MDWVQIYTFIGIGLQLRPFCKNAAKGWNFAIATLIVYAAYMPLVGRIFGWW